MARTRATKAQLQEEIEALRRRLAEWEAADRQHRQHAASVRQHAETLDALHATVTTPDGKTFVTTDGGQTWRET